MTATLGRDSVEVVVATQWATVLQAPPVGLDDNFFDAGGSSLAAARLAGTLARAVGRDVPLHVVFDLPTVREQSDWLRDQHAEGAPQGLVRLRAGGTGRPVVLLPGGGGSLVGLNHFAGPIFDRPVYGLLAPGLQGGKPARDLDALVEHFVRTMEAEDIPRDLHLAGFCAGGILAHALAGALTDSGWTVRSVLMLETAPGAPDLTREEIMRERVADLAAAAGVSLGDEQTLEAADLYERFRAQGMDLLENDAESFVRRLRVFASMWRMVAEFRPRMADVPTVLFSVPERLEDCPDDVVDWCDLGLPAFRQVDVDDAVTRLNLHEPTLRASEAWFEEHDE
jgi:thioesterase domain-containing protein